MLPAAHRLTDADSYRAVVRRGHRAGGAVLVVHATAATPEGPADPAETPEPRIGFVVGSAVGNAVVRNRVRRRLRHLAAGHLADLGPGSSVVVRALAPAATASFEELRVELARCLVRATGPGPGSGSRGGRTKVGSS